MSVNLNRIVPKEIELRIFFQGYAMTFNYIINYTYIYFLICWITKLGPDETIITAV